MEEKTAVSPDQLQQFDDRNILVIDVRSEAEFDDLHIPFAKNIPIEKIESGIFIPQPGTIIITVCGKGGGRSEKAADYIRKNYMTEVYFLEGGTFGWYENQNKHQK